MLKLYSPQGNISVRLPGNASLECLPVSTPIAYAARARADSLLAELVSAGEAVTKAGGRLHGVPDLSSEDGLSGARQALFVVSLAELAAVGWTGIGGDDGSELSFAASHMAQLMLHPGVAEAFQSQYLNSLHGLIAEGNA